MITYAIATNIYGENHKIKINTHEAIWLIHNNHYVSLKIIDKNNKLKSLACGFNKIIKIKIIGGKNIERIWCFRNNLKELDLSMCENLKILHCDVELENNIKLPNHKLISINYE